MKKLFGIEKVYTKENYENFTSDFIIIFYFTDDSPLIPLNQRDKVREFIEELISSLVGGSIEDATVGQLYNNYECKYRMTKICSIFLC